MLTSIQELQLQALLLNRHRRLVACYQDKRGRLWAVSREIDSKTARNDLQHEIQVIGDDVIIRLTHYPDGVAGPEL